MPVGQRKDRFDSAAWCRAKATTLRVQAECCVNAVAMARAFEIAAEWEAKADELDRPASVTAGRSNRARIGERTLLPLRRRSPLPNGLLGELSAVAAGRTPVRCGICGNRAQSRCGALERFGGAVYSNWMPALTPAPSLRLARPLRGRAFFWLRPNTWVQFYGTNRAAVHQKIG
jgi:hypothetical protein